MFVCLFVFSLIRNVAQGTLNQVDDIETALNSSDHVRQEVMSLQGQTDQMISNINNITETVSKTPSYFRRTAPYHGLKGRKFESQA